MNIACYIFGISMALYKNITNEFIYEKYNEYIHTINLSENINDNIPIMIISHINNNHYNLLYFNEEFENNNEI